MLNLTIGYVDQRKSFEELLCSPEFAGRIRYQLICFLVMNILIAITAFLENSLILVALHKECSLYPPTKLLFRCLAITDLCVGLISSPVLVVHWIFVVSARWNICRYTFRITIFPGYVLCLVSLFTVTAISVDRLLALMLGLTYKHVVTMKQMRVIVTIFWVVSIFGALVFFWNRLITLYYSYVALTVCLVISTFSYTKIFHTLRLHQIQVKNQDFQEQTRRTIPQRNIARYRRTVNSVLLLQLALIICYLPYGIADALKNHIKLSPTVYFARQMTMTLVYFNSSLNPILYCWKIREVRQAVKRTVRQFFCSST